MTRAATGLDRVVVVVPAHDEEELLGRCLDAVDVAVDALGTGLEVRTVVVLDGCTDRSAQVVRGRPVTVVGTTARTVGRARSLGVAVGAAGVPDPHRCWVASTDADSTVPREWLLEQVSAASAGADVVVGRVLPDAATLAEGLLQRWLARHPPGRASVHGANLGVRLGHYRAAGGFPPLATGEDVALVEALRGTGARLETGRTPVVTSSRLEARAPDGFAAYLRRLTADATRPAPA